MRKLTSFIMAMVLLLSAFSVCDFGILSRALDSDDTLKVNFEGKQSDFYVNNYITDSSNTAGTVNIGGDHGRIMQLSRIRVYRPDLPNHIVTQWPAAFVLPDKDCSSRAQFKKGDVISISFDMIKNTSISEEFFTEITAALVFDPQLETKTGNMGSINTYVDGGKTVTIATADCKKDTAWMTYSAVISVPCDGTAAFIVYATKWAVNCNIYIDNISISKVNGLNVDFEGAQKTFYQNNAVTASDTTAGTKETGDNHGTVMQVMQLRAYRPDLPNHIVTQWPAAFVLPDSVGKGRLSFNKGEMLSVSFEMKKNKDISEEFFKSFTVAMVFDENLRTLKGNMGSINNYVDSGKTVSLASIDCKKDDDWVTYNAIVTVPRSGTAAFMLYGTNWSVQGCEIYLDNINIKKVEGTEETVVKLHNIDGNGGTKEIKEKEVTMISQLEIPFLADKKFDGWYLDSAFSKPASGYIGKTTDLWIKWNSQKDKIVNNYDEKQIEYTEIQDNNYILTSRKINGISAGEKYFAQYDARVMQNEFDETAQKSVKFTCAQGYTYNWPATLSIYDNNDKNFKLFVPKPNSAYSITFKYKVDSKPAQALNFQLRRLADNGGIWYDPNNVITEQIVSVAQTTKGWVTVKKNFYTGDNVSNLALVLCAANSTTYGFSVENVNVWVDDIAVEELYNSPSIYFETAGGSKLSRQVCTVGDDIPTLPVPTKADCIFDGWYLDAEYTQPLTLTKMPESNIRVYARWKTPARTAYSLKTDFEECQYSNNGKNPDVPDNRISEDVVWKSDSERANSGSGYLQITNKNVTETSVGRSPAVSFVTDDGTGYEVIAGERYHVSFAFRCSQSPSQRIIFVSSQQVPVGGLNLKSATQESVFTYHPMLCDVPLDAWGIYDVYFIAKNTGKLYMLFMGDGVETLMDLDTFSIEPVREGEATRVRYYDAENIIEEQYGKTGTRLIDPSITNKEGLEFGGWMDENDHPYVKSIFPASDIDLHALWVKADDLSSASTDWNGNVTVDFEDSEGCKSFYGVYNNSTEPVRGTYYVADDPDNAHSGNGYFKLDNVGVWSSKWYRRFKLFDGNTLGNQIYLDANSVYKVSYWLNLKKAGSSCIMLAAFEERTNVINCFYEGYNFLSDASNISDMGKWVLHEATITTGNESATLGMAISGGWITASIDDITVTKLKDVTVSFESNGGNNVSPITVLSYDCAIAPHMPEREGYNFTGWFTDAQLTQKFRFTETPVINSITLYAGWEKKFVPETKYRNITSYDNVEEIVPNVPEDAELDEIVSIGTSDQKTAKKTEKETSVKISGPQKGKWMIIGGSVLVIFLLVAAIAIVLRHKGQRRNKAKRGVIK